MAAPVTRPQFGPLERPLRLHFPGTFGALKVQNKQAKNPTQNKGKKTPTQNPNPGEKGKVKPRRPGLPIITPDTLPVSVYVTVRTHCIWAGVGPVVSSTITLTGEAIAAGVRQVIDLEQNNTTFGEYAHVTVFRAPAGYGLANNLFNVTLAGTSYIFDPAPDPTVICGHTTSVATIQLTSVFGGVGGIWTATWSTTTPNGVDSGTMTDIVGTRFEPPWPFTEAIVANNNYDTQSLWRYDAVAGEYINMTLPCTATPPTRKELPFEVSVVVNPVAGHTVQDPGWDYDVGAVIHPTGGGTFDGTETQVFGWSVNHHALDGSTNFALANRRLSKFGPTRIPMVWPTGAITGAPRYDAVGPYVRKLLPPPTVTPSVDRKFAWNDGVHAQKLCKCGFAPPYLAYDPYP